MYLDKLKGTKIITFEETTPSHWLYTELKDHADEIVVCDPYRNKLLKDGPKDDKTDARDLVMLLKAGLLKAVYHEDHKFIYIRKLMSGYQDAIKTVVRLKNQRSALLRSLGKGKKETIEQEGSEKFVLDGIKRALTCLEAEVTRYQQEFEQLCRQHKMIRNLKTIPGVGTINATKIAAYVVDTRRFKKNGNFFGYCGLVKHDRISGGKSYGKKKPRYNRILKNVFDTAAVSVIESKACHSLYEYYTYLIEQKRYPTHNARRALSRRIAVISLSVMRSEKPYDPRRRQRRVEENR